MATASCDAKDTLDRWGVRSAEQLNFGAPSNLRRIEGFGGSRAGFTMNRKQL
ncbi:MAG: hypothetical protein ABF254_08660 [Octadecabacter sp.]